ncbi:hypothetical protein [Dongia sp.]|uniref:hypothetical protein n=1 Tax=Dongia sp. TaxID=1977262 RepID=UPI0037512FC9
MKRRAARKGILAAAALLFTGGSVLAEETRTVCAKIAQEVNRLAPQRPGSGLYDLSTDLMALLPPGIRYLESKQLSPDDLARILRCDSAANCPVAADTKAADYFEYPNDSAWHTETVDTRPKSRFMFVFTGHHGHDRCDQLSAFEQQADESWARSAFAFTEADVNCDDSGFAVLMDDKKPYVVVPPGSASFGDLEGYSGGGEDPLVMTVFDPEDSELVPVCRVGFHLSSRLGLGWPSIELDGTTHDFVASKLDSDLARMADLSRFSEDAPGQRFVETDDFIARDTPSDKLAEIRAFLLSNAPGPTLTALAMRELDLADEGVVETTDPNNWTARWMPFGAGGRAFAALLIRYSGPGFFARGPHLYERAVVALFVLNGGKLEPIEAAEIQHDFWFSRAEAMSGGKW